MYSLKLLLLAVLLVGVLRYSTAAVCEVREEVPAHHHMCYTVTGEVEEVTFRNVVKKKWVLQRPTDCLSSPFPCFGVVQEVTVVEKVPVTTRVCQLEAAWRWPRRILQSYNNITLVLTPGYLQQRNYSHQLLCMWNITCPEDHLLYVNSTDLVLQGSDRDCTDYVQLEWGNRTEVRCGGHTEGWLLNQVSDEHLKVVFRSDEHNSGTGIRLDTMCYRSEPPQHGAEGNSCSGQDQVEFSPQEESLVRKAFALHFELHLLMDACRRGVKECAQYNVSHLSSIIQPTLAELKAASGTCNAAVSSLADRTVELYH